jgi:hypothetical protein
MASMMTSNNQFDNKMSIFIPRCDTRSLPRRHVNNSQEEYEAIVADFIGKQFLYQKVGDVERVDVVEKNTPDGYTFFIAFVHFNEWFDCQRNRELQAKIVSEKERAVLQFHEKWFWILNKNKKPLTATEADMAKKLGEQEKEIEALREQIENMRALIHTDEQVPVYMTLPDPLSVEDLEDGEIDNTPPPSPPRLIRQNAHDDPRYQTPLPQPSLQRSYGPDWDLAPIKSSSTSFYDNFEPRVLFKESDFPPLWGHQGNSLPPVLPRQSGAAEEEDKSENGVSEE